MSHASVPLSRPRSDSEESEPQRTVFGVPTKVWYQADVVTAMAVCDLLARSEWQRHRTLDIERSTHLDSFHAISTLASPALAYPAEVR